MGANPERQEVQLNVMRGEEEKVYTLKLTTAGCINLEKRLGRTTGEILQQIGKFSVSDARDIIHALLQKFHGKEFPPTEKGFDAVNDLIDDAGGVAGIIKLIAEAVAVRKDSTTDAAEAEQGPNPPEAQAGNGDASTLRLAALA